MKQCNLNTRIIWFCHIICFHKGLELNSLFYLRGINMKNILKSFPVSESLFSFLFVLHPSYPKKDCFIKTILLPVKWVKAHGKKDSHSTSISRTNAFLFFLCFCLCQVGTPCRKASGKLIVRHLFSLLRRNMELKIKQLSFPRTPTCLCFVSWAS